MPTRSSIQNTNYKLGPPVNYYYYFHNALADPQIVKNQSERVSHIFSSQIIRFSYKKLMYISYLPAGRSVKGKTVTEAPGPRSAYSGRGHSFSPYGPTISR